jgi:plasmid stabilization system protein ParE
VARTVKWTETAAKDLEEVAEFIGRDSRFYAAALVREARAAARSLRTFAERGRVVPEIDTLDIREIFVRATDLYIRSQPITFSSSRLHTVLVTLRLCESAVVDHQRRTPNRVEGSAPPSHTTRHAGPHRAVPAVTTLKRRNEGPSTVAACWAHLGSTTIACSGHVERCCCPP